MVGIFFLVRTFFSQLDFLHTRGTGAWVGWVLYQTIIFVTTQIIINNVEQTFDILYFTSCGFNMYEK